MLSKNTRISAATVAVALVTALLLALLATPAKPAKAAEPQSYLQLISLVCHETEDTFGADEPYLRVGGNVVWSGSLNDNDSANLQGLPEIPFPHTGSISVALFEDDSPDTDDFLGEVFVSHAQADGTNKTAVFDLDDARYTLTYRVRRDTNNPPAIDPLTPRPGSKVRDRTPNIVATVRDDFTDLSRSNIQFFLDNRAKSSFSYDAGTDRLSYLSSKLSHGRHTAKVVATDAQGLTATQAWSFSIVRRR
jgi:hypothetical protein